jgi:hydroxymethylglutaryl-CoA reductase
MASMKSIAGFSRKSKTEKLAWLKHFFPNPEEASRDFEKFWLPDAVLQTRFDGFSENTLSNFIIPYGIAPNFLINDQWYAVPMVVEESSVVAAAASAAKYWMNKGGFQCTVLNTQKEGQVHFTWEGSESTLREKLPDLQRYLAQQTAYLTSSMEKRGGGVTGIQLKSFPKEAPGLFQLLVQFETVDSMGANFINSVLEAYASWLPEYFQSRGLEQPPKVVMAILSNYTPECRVRAEVQYPAAEMGRFPGGLKGLEFAEKFAQAIQIAKVDPYRATTHNKGIFNGIDAVVIATGNDFRAVEAAGHAYAARSGQYRSLSQCTIVKGIFHFSLEIPLAIGTVGGLTTLHPLAQRSLELLGNPSAQELMQIIAATGLAQNFAAVRSLVTTGIQSGHMKMHLGNILHHLQATESQTAAAQIHFQNHPISHRAVAEFLAQCKP